MQITHSFKPRINQQGSTFNKNAPKKIRGVSLVILNPKLEIVTCLKRRNIKYGFAPAPIFNSTFLVLNFSLRFLQTHCIAYRHLLRHVLTHFHKGNGLWGTVLHNGGTTGIRGFAHTLY